MESTDRYAHTERYSKREGIVTEFQKAAVYSSRYLHCLRISAQRAQFAIKGMSSSFEMISFSISFALKD